MKPLSNVVTVVVVVVVTVVERCRVFLAPLFDAVATVVVVVTVVADAAIAAVVVVVVLSGMKYSRIFASEDFRKLLQKVS